MKSIIFKVAISITTAVVAFSIFGFSSKAAISINQASEDSPVYGTVRNANMTPYVYTDSNSQSTIIKTLPVGTDIMIVGSTSLYYKVQYSTYGCSYGYVNKQCIAEKSSSCVGKIKCNVSSGNLNFRSTAGTSNNVIGSIPKGKYAVAKVNAGSGSFRKAFWGDKNGYVSISYSAFYYYN